MSKILISIFIVGILTISLVDISSSWTKPVSTPTENDSAPPINEGLDIQQKLGSFGVSGLAAFGGATFAGGMQIKDGTQGEGKILISDLKGTAQWVTPPQYAPAGTVQCPEGTTLMSTGECGYEYTKPYVYYDFCSGNDELVKYWDVGHGNNHGVAFIPPNGCYAWEGGGNHGGQGCAMSCRGSVKMCMKMVGGQPEWYLSGTDKKCN